MPIQLIETGPSGSFPDGFQATSGQGSGAIFLGADAGSAYQRRGTPSDAAFCAVELGTECLALHIGLDDDPAHRRTVGFARFRLGRAAPSMLIEIVRTPWTEDAAIAAARAAFEAAGFKTALCEDVPGRIVDRLIRPYLNAVLRRYDDKLASAQDLDTTLKLGLGYPEGPLALLDRTGLDHHHDVSQALHQALGDSDFAPARRAQVAKARKLAGG